MLGTMPMWSSTQPKASVRRTRFGSNIVQSLICSKDTIYEEHLIMLRSSSVELVSALFDDSSKGRKKSATKDTKKDQKKATVGVQFQSSLGLVDYA